MKLAVIIALVCACLGVVEYASAATMDVLKLGAKGDGKRDDSGVIQKALALAGKKGGGQVFLPAGKYRLNKPLTVPTGVTLCGTWKTPHHAQNTGGTILLAYAGKAKEDGPPLISLSPSSAVTGLTIYYPEQKIPAIPYPWTIQGAGMHPSVENVTLVNPYKGIDFGTLHNELHYIRNVFGCPLKAGVNVDNCTDVGRVENVHFNPHYWMRSGAKNLPTWEELGEYIHANCIAFDIGFSDWEMFTNTFCFGTRVGYRFRNNADKHGCNGSFLSIAADATERAVLVEDCRIYGLLITNGEFVSREGAAACLEVLPTNKGVVQLSNCAFWGKFDRAALIAGEGSVSLNQCNFQHWDYGKKGLPAVEAIGGDVIVQGCQFLVPLKQIVIGENVTTAIVQGNRFRQIEVIENRCKGDVQIGMNVVRKS